VSIFSHLFGRNIKKNEIGGACGMYEGEESLVEGFGGEN
jgi:hypothetical protein